MAKGKRPTEGAAEGSAPPAKKQKVAGKDNAQKPNNKGGKAPKVKKEKPKKPRFGGQARPKETPLTPAEKAAAAAYAAEVRGDIKAKLADKPIAAAPERKKLKTRLTSLKPLMDKITELAQNDGQEKKRAEFLDWFLTTLNSQQLKSGGNDIEAVRQEWVDYVRQRLVKATPTHQRGKAYADMLRSLLQKCDRLTVKAIVEDMDKFLSVSPESAHDRAAKQSLGARVFVIKALAESGKEIKKEELHRVTEILVEQATKVPSTSAVVSQVVSNLVKGQKPAVVAQSLFPVLNVPTVLDKFTSDSLHWALLVHRRLSGVDMRDDSVLKTLHQTILKSFSADKLGKLQSVIYPTLFSGYPVVHPVWESLLDAAFAHEQPAEQFRAVWKSFIVEPRKAKSYRGKPWWATLTHVVELAVPRIFNLPDEHERNELLYLLFNQSPSILQKALNSRRKHTQAAAPQQRRRGAPQQTNETEEKPKESEGLDWESLIRQWFDVVGMAEGLITGGEDEDDTGDEKEDGSDSESESVDVDMNEGADEADEEGLKQVLKITAEGLADLDEDKPALLFRNIIQRALVDDLARGASRLGASKEQTAGVAKFFLTQALFKVPNDAGRGEAVFEHDITKELKTVMFDNLWTLLNNTFAQSSGAFIQTFEATVSGMSSFELRFARYQKGSPVAKACHRIRKALAGQTEESLDALQSVPKLVSRLLCMLHLYLLVTMDESLYEDVKKLSGQCGANVDRDAVLESLFALVASYADIDMQGLHSLHAILMIKKCALKVFNSLWSLKDFRITADDVRQIVDSFGLGKIEDDDEAAERRKKEAELAKQRKAQKQARKEKIEARKAAREADKKAGKKPEKKQGKKRKAEELEKEESDQAESSGDDQDDDVGGSAVDEALAALGESRIAHQKEQLDAQRAEQSLCSHALSMLQSVITKEGTSPALYVALVPILRLIVRHISHSVDDVAKKALATADTLLQTKPKKSENSTPATEALAALTTFVDFIAPTAKAGTKAGKDSATVAGRRIRGRFIVHSNRRFGDLDKNVQTNFSNVVTKSIVWAHLGLWQFGNTNEQTLGHTLFQCFVVSRLCGTPFGKTLGVTCQRYPEIAAQAFLPPLNDAIKSADGGLGATEGESTSKGQARHRLAVLWTCWSSVIQCVANTVVASGNEKATQAVKTSLLSVFPVLANKKRMAKEKGGLSEAINGALETVASAKVLKDLLEDKSITAQQLELIPRKARRGLLRVDSKEAAKGGEKKEEKKEQKGGTKGKPQPKQAASKGNTPKGAPPTKKQKK